MNLNYIISCPDCDEELFEGDKLEARKWLKDMDKDEYAVWDDKQISCLCNDCIYLLDK